MSAAEDETVRDAKRRVVKRILTWENCWPTSRGSRAKKNAQQKLGVL
jgi:hypothetical protein